MTWNKIAQRRPMSHLLQWVDTFRASFETKTFKWLADRRAISLFIAIDELAQPTPQKEKKKKKEKKRQQKTLARRLARSRTWNSSRCDIVLSSPPMSKRKWLNIQTRTKKLSARRKDKIGVKFSAYCCPLSEWPSSNECLHLIRI